MDPYSLSIGSLTIIEACLKCGKVLLRLINDYKSAEAAVAETCLKLKVIWNKTETQMTVLQEIWDSLNSNLQNNQILLLSLLERKLQEAIHLLNRVIGTKSELGSLSYLLGKKGAVRKANYAVRVKDSLERTLSELVEWHNLFDPSWFLLARSTSSEIDRTLEAHSKEEPIKLLNALRKSVRDLNPDLNAPARPISARDFLGPRRAIASSPVAIAQIEGRLQDGVVDSMLVNQDMDPEGTTRGVIALAKVLSRMDPSSFGLLRCCGVINKTQMYEFVFEIPQEFESPRSLRDLLTEAKPSLNVKLDIAKQLARSVFYLHTTGFVHKNIRPDTILIFDHNGKKSPFLFGFENFRTVEAETFKIGDASPERELYRHPSRQGNNPERRYVMQHDIYSLGVCLLEIGLWRSFVTTDGNTAVIEFEPSNNMKDSTKRAFAVKKELLVATNEQLSQRTGQRFKNVVQSCLTCLDDSATWDHVDTQSAAEIDVGVEFIENVLLQLQEIII